MPESRHDEPRNDKLIRQYQSSESPSLGIRSADSSQNGSPRRVSGRMSPNLVLEKSAPENATVGAPLDYRIFVRNEGDATAYDVVVEDDVTAAARVEGTNPRSALDIRLRKLRWEFAQIEPGGTQEITVRVTPTGEGLLDGMASVKFKSRVQATTVITAPKLRLKMQGPGQVRLGEEVVYRYIITNEGSGVARNVSIRTLLPASGGLKHSHGRDLECDIEAIQPGEQREIVLAVEAGELGEHAAEAVVATASGTAANAAWRTEVIGAQLQIVRRGPKRRFVSRAATYVNIISNQTSLEALEARVVEVVPKGMRYMGSTMDGQYDEAKHQVTWLLGRLGAGRHEQLQLQLMPTRAGSMESVVTIQEKTGIQSEGHVSTTVVEDLHNVSATISQLDGPIATGEPFGLTISIDNRGTADAADVELRVEVPREIEVIAAGSLERSAQVTAGTAVEHIEILRIAAGKKQGFALKLRGQSPIDNGVVKATVRCKNMINPLIVSESVTIYSEEP